MAWLCVSLYMKHNEFSVKAWAPLPGHLIMHMQIYANSPKSTTKNTSGHRCFRQGTLNCMDKFLTFSLDDHHLLLESLMNVTVA